MRTIGSLIMLILGIVIFLFAMPYLWILLLIMVIAMIFFYYRSKHTLNQSKKDIDEIWKDSRKNSGGYDESVEEKKHTDVIDAEFEEREVKDK